MAASHSMHRQRMTGVQTTMLSKPVQETAAVGFTPWLFQCYASDAVNKRAVSAAAVIGWFKAGVPPYRFGTGPTKAKSKPRMTTASERQGGGGGGGGSIHNNFHSLDFPHISKRTLEALVLLHTGKDKAPAKLAKRRLLLYLPEKLQRRVRGGWDGLDELSRPPGQPVAASAPRKAKPVGGPRKGKRVAEAVRAVREDSSSEEEAGGDPFSGERQRARQPRSPARQSGNAAAAAAAAGSSLSHAEGRSKRGRPSNAERAAAAAAAAAATEAAVASGECWRCSDCGQTFKPYSACAPHGPSAQHIGAGSWNDVPPLCCTAWCSLVKRL